MHKHRSAFSVRLTLAGPCVLAALATGGCAAHGSAGGRSAQLRSHQSADTMAGATRSAAAAQTRTVAHRAPVQPNRTTLNINLNRPGIHVSPTLWGIFFEEINYAGEGGLYAELVKNSTFKWLGNNRPKGWRLQVAPGAGAGLFEDLSHPLNKANPAAARVDVYRPSKPGQTQLVNGGYWGMNFKKGASYKLTFVARRSPGMSGRVRVALLGKNGKHLAVATVSGIGRHWKEFSAKFKSAGGDPHGKLAFILQGTGSLWLNVVTLFPTHTWKHQANGLRPDLAHLLAQLRPSFVRFPGGNYIEGNVLANGFHWKRTIGPLAGRPGHFDDSWGYWVTDGLGYEEFLEMCQDLHAQPLFDIPCGLSLGMNDRVPLKDMKPVVQDAVDAVNFANAPVSNKWGALRAKFGHPKPFHLGLMEVGNESWWAGPYSARYKMFHQVLHKKFPHLKLIASGSPGKTPVNIVDEHHYSSPAWFWDNRHMFDTRSRKGPRLFLGEYAVTTHCGHGNLRAALAEAAWMTGVERNSDLIAMASYAPLFVNIHGRQWNPDLIEFNSAHAWGTASYWVQEMFSRNRVTRMLPLTHRLLVAAKPKRSATNTGVGLGNWATRAQYKNLTITSGGKTIYTSNFTHGADGFRPVSGAWSATHGAYQQTGSGTPELSLMKLPALRNLRHYTVRVQARKLSGKEGFLIIPRVVSPKNLVWWNVGGWGDSNTAFQHLHGRNASTMGHLLPVTVRTGKWYHLRIVVRGNTYAGYLNGKLIQRVSAVANGVRFAAVAGVNVPQKMVIVQVVNGTKHAISTRLNFSGAKLGSKGTAITLTASSLNAENTLHHPLRVSPRVHPIAGVHAGMMVRFPARSLTFLRLPEK